MRHLLTATATVVTILVLGGCANSLIRKSGTIENGMSKQEVVRLLGSASDKQFRGKNEAWQYCELGAVTSDFLVVWFYEGSVTGLTTYKDSSPSLNCTGQLRTVQWENAPDTTIEVRKR